VNAGLASALAAFIVASRVGLERFGKRASPAWIVVIGAEAGWAAPVRTVTSLCCDVDAVVRVSRR